MRPLSLALVVLTSLATWTPGAQAAPLDPIIKGMIGAKDEAQQILRPVTGPMIRAIRGQIGRAAQRKDYQDIAGEAADYLLMDRDRTARALQGGPTARAVVRESLSEGENKVGVAWGETARVREKVVEEITMNVAVCAEKTDWRPGVEFETCVRAYFRDAVSKLIAG